MSDDADKATDAANVADILKHIGGSQSESSPHTRCANALADGIASQVALARRFNIRVMLRIEKTEALTKTTLLRMFWMETTNTDLVPGLEEPSDLLDGPLRGQCQIADGCCEKARRLAAGHHSVVVRLNGSTRCTTGTPLTATTC
jgi:hypothetical protein